MINRLLKFADDTKLMGKVSTQQEIDSLQDDLQKLVEWADTWQLPFNTEICKVMHIGYNNSSSVYSIMSKNLTVVKEEIDFGVVVSDDMKVHKQLMHKGFKL